MSTVKKHKSFKYWFSQALQIVLMVTVLSIGMDWYRTKDIPNEQAPPLRVLMANGEYLDVIGKSYDEPIVVYFWATWCAACKFVSPSVSWLSDYYEVVAVSGASGPKERVEQFMQVKDYQFNNINDPNSQIMRDWHISVTPTIYVIKEGEVSSITTGVTTPIGILTRIWMA
ncbi:protein disulfide oxidoreductase [Vibrio alfacsensis]|uniref:Protein disulfide oxidoreductase n=1 Tax=Vibrio alfacsensis TaxID=1074311 RepID=A0ABN5PGP9_9VIBR|nr:protein disulfide oxidoreductase [Vibrio alfacsensis]AXY01417.1 protein disulfide oxidoreductase [Vibrio alfacsensis]